jgi:hypothetical protein
MAIVELRIISSNPIKVKHNFTCFSAKEGFSAPNACDILMPQEDPIDPMKIRQIHRIL